MAINWTVDHKHTLVVDRDAWYIRFYVWLWDASESDINFCKLFWGLTLAPVGLFFRGVGLALSPVARRLGARDKARKAAKHQAMLNAPYAPPEPKAVTGPSRMQRLLNGIAGGFSRFALVVSRFWDFLTRHKRLNWLVVRASIGLAGLCGAAIVGVLGYLIVIHFSFVLLALAAMLAGVGAVLCIAVLKVIGFWDALGRKALVPAGRGVKGGTLGLVGVLSLGYTSVKSNTCPRVEIKDAA